MQFFPLRLNFFILLAIILIIFRFAQQPVADTSSFHHFLLLMSKIGFLILMVLLSLSLISTLVACVYFIRHRHHFKVAIQASNDDRHPFKVHTVVEKIFRPILGNIGVRYLYNDYELSPQFVLHNRQKFSIFPSISHQSAIDLPNIKEYNLQSALLTFQDLFRFFSFTFKNPIQSQFINLPQIVDTSSPIAKPATTQTDIVRTPNLQKIAGEWLEYKKYEPTDDIRRIVWKVYARNKELIVRKQEVFSPIASHIDCFISFYTTTLFSEDCLDAMSDCYKNHIWSFFNIFNKGELEVKLHFDQFQMGTKDKRLIAEQIAQAGWQGEIAASKFFDIKKGSVFFIHSLMPYEEIEKVALASGKNNLIIYVNLTHIFKQEHKMPLYKKLFFKPLNVIQEDLLNNYRSSPSRLAVQKNIVQHKKILQNAMAQIEIIE